MLLMASACIRRTNDRIIRIFLVKWEKGAWISMLRIIIVEDEARARQGVAVAIANLPGGHAVVAQANNGKTGLDLIEKLKPDLVFTDVKMDTMNGIEMIAKLRENGNDVQIVIISAYEEFEFAKAAVAYGVIGYITKPITPEEIEQCIQKADRNLPERQETGADALEQASGEGVHPSVARALQIIEQEYAGPISLDDVSRRLHLTPQYFCMLFRKYTGDGFNNYLRQYRVKIAKDILLSGSMKVGEVGESVGYPDSKYFSRIFKSEAGMTPTQFVFRHSSQK